MIGPWVAMLLASPGCREGTLPTSGSVRARISVQARINASVSARADLGVFVALGYQRLPTGGGPGDVVHLASTSADAVGAGTLRIPLEADLGPCLTDPRRAADGEGCPLVVSLALRRNGTTLDSTSTGPVVARPGAAVTLDGPITLHEVSLLRLSWPGSAPAAGGDTLRAGRTLALVVVAEDASGAAVAGIAVDFASSNPLVATVSAQGVVTAVAPGTATITARAAPRGGGTVAGRLATFLATVLPAPAALEVVSGDGQRVAPGGVLAAPLVVKLTDPSGNPVPGILVSFVVTAGGGQVANDTQRTDAAGLAQGGPWTLGPSPAVNTIEARVTGLAALELTGYATIVPVYDSLAVGNFHACQIELAGRTACWGSRIFGQLGDGSTSGVGARTGVAGNPAFVSLASRGSHTCGRTAASAHLCWGRNSGSIALGNGNQANPISTPTALSGGPFRVVAPARVTTCALTPTGVAMCWGVNQQGEVGDGTTANRLTPTSVQTALTFASIEAGWLHTCALTAARATHCWGGGAFVGRADTAKALVPELLPGNHVFERLTAGSTHSCGLKATGEAWCWGTNLAGQLGDGTTSSNGQPVRVTGGLYFSMLSAGTLPNTPANHTCGITITGAAYCWGGNASGQLGNGTTTASPLPVQVQSNEVFVAIGAGDSFSCAMTPDRRVFCWGNNASGELGSGVAGGSSPVPVLVP